MSDPPAGGCKPFATSAELRAWLEKNHDSVAELTVLLHKKGSGLPSITWPELVDQLLCFGWIDGVRRSAGPDSYTIRITPRRPRSHWSAVNLNRVPELAARGLMTAAGTAAYEARDDKRSKQYSYEGERSGFGRKEESAFEANPRAWAYFRAQPPGYKRLVTGWVMSAKREDTRKRRLERLIRDSGNRERVDLSDPFRRRKRPERKPNR